MTNAIPEKAQRIIDRSLDDLIPTIERSAGVCITIRKELATTLERMQWEDDTKINYNNLSSTFYDLSQAYPIGSPKHEFYGGLAASIGVLTGQTGGQYEPRALRAGRENRYVRVKSLEDEGED